MPTKKQNKRKQASEHTCEVEHHTHPMLNIGLLREAIEEAAVQGVRTAKIEKARKHLADIVEYTPGDLVEYQDMENNWIRGVIVAWMLHQPEYACGPGDDREKTGPDLLAMNGAHIRPRS